MADTETAEQQFALEPERVAELIESGGAQLVDVRVDVEYEAGRIAGARHIPLARLQQEAGELDRATPVVLYCRSGERSGAAAEAFRASGWEAHSMDGGLVAWVERGLPLEPKGGVVAARSHLPGECRPLAGVRLKPERLKSEKPPGFSLLASFDVARGG